MGCDSPISVNLPKILLARSVQRDPSSNDLTNGNSKECNKERRQNVKCIQHSAQHVHTCMVRVEREEQAESERVAEHTDW